MEKGMDAVAAVLGSLSAQGVNDAQQCSDKVSAQYNVLGHGPRLVMVAYDDLT